MNRKNAAALTARFAVLPTLCGVGLLFSTLASIPSCVQADAKDYFRITVIDQDTGRGVPLVELRTTTKQRFFTDSNGIAAIGEPELMGQNVYFSVKSHGYDLPADTFGNRGQAFKVTAGGSGQIKIKRINIAERLYRITGAGIYRDSVLTGQKVPIAHPLLNGGVAGQDTVMSTIYKGKIYWFYGDTDRTGYPLGNFATSGATSLLPGKGGLDPSVGVDLTYWVDENGFSKKMLPLPEEGGPVWVGGVFTLKDANGQEQLYTRYLHLKVNGKDDQSGLALFNDDKALFERVLVFNGPLWPDGQPFRVTVKGVPYLYFQSNSQEAYPLVRVQADKEHVLNPNAYEAFTPLQTGGRFEKGATKVERDAQGRLVYGWKANTASVSFNDRKALVEAGVVKNDELPFQLRDIQSDAILQSHGGSVYWNPYRQRWVMISGQAFGTPSYLGELWYAEADTPTGPWAYARKIITHDKYTFYNPTQHPYFDQEGGRLIYLEGTYVTTYSGNEDPTPLYDYNQVMYRLNLDDARLALPAPIYTVKVAGALQYGARDKVTLSDPSITLPFFAIPPERALEGKLPIYAGAKPGQLSLQPAGANASPIFYALPTTVGADKKPSPAIVPLYEYSTPDGKYWYGTGETRPAGAPNEAIRAAQSLCRVWRNPSSTLALDADAVAQYPM